MKAEYLADMPDLDAVRDRVAELLGLALQPEDVVLARLHAVALGIGADYALVFTPEGTTYRQLIAGPAHSDQWTAAGPGSRRAR